MGGASSAAEAAEESSADASAPGPEAENPAATDAAAGTENPAVQTGTPDSAGTQVTWQAAGLALETAVAITPASGPQPGKTVAVKMSAPDGYTIAYTADGSSPTSDDDTGLSEVSVELTGPSDYLFAHKDLMIMRDFTHMTFNSDPALPAGIALTVCLVDAEGRLSDPVTRTYFPDVDFAEAFPGCLVLSIRTDPANLLDYNTGILATGAVYDAWRKTPEAASVIEARRWWEALTNSTEKGRGWERPCEISFYDNGGRFLAGRQAGMRIRGGMSRGYMQKSFNFYFRKDYDPEPLTLDLFGREEAHKALSLRSGGNTTDTVKFMDPLLEDLARGRKVMVLNMRPAVLFINGEYWGPFSLNEKLSDDLMAARFGVDKDEVILVKETELEEGEDGDYALFEELMSFADKDLSDPETFELFSQTMDIQSMADHFALRIYMGDGDWKPDTNDVLWRTRDASYNEGRWQYILYDTEYSSGLYGVPKTSAETDHFQRALDEYPLFAAAMRNKTFYDLFLEALEKTARETYPYERVREAVETCSAAWAPLMDTYYLRFGGNPDSYAHTLENMLNFYEVRADYILPVVKEWSERPN